MSPQTACITYCYSNISNIQIINFQLIQLEIDHKLSLRMSDRVKQNIKLTTDEVESQVVGTNFKIGKKLGAGKLINLFF